MQVLILSLYLCRKVPSSSDSEDETEEKKARSEEASDKKKGTRPRRDKMAKESDHRTVFVGNLPLTVKKKVIVIYLRFYHIFRTKGAQDRTFMQ